MKLTDIFSNDLTQINPCGENFLSQYDNYYEDKLLTRKVLFEKTNKFQWEPIMCTIDSDINIGSKLFIEHLQLNRIHLFNLLKISKEDLFVNDYFQNINVLQPL